MAKTQTFADKVNKKSGANKISVKIIKGYTSEIGSTRFIEKMVSVEDLSALNKIEI